MANNPTSKNIISASDQLDDPFQLVPTLKQHVTPATRLLVALSGGVDSIVLLDQLVALNKVFPYQLHAMHVHHGLSLNADTWAAQCQYLCQRYQVPFTIQRLKVNQHSRLGLEAEARALRYHALAQYQCDGHQPDWIITAHHQADQAETLLLQLCRGAGVKGVSAMPVAQTAQRLLRPMLHVEKALILQYAKQNNLSWCEDESNQSLDFDRNFIRHEVMPVLASRYPSVTQSLSRSASLFAEAQTLNADLAQIDAKRLIKGNRLYLPPLNKLSTPRVKNVLRYWLDLHQLQMPSQKQLHSIIEQLLYAKHDAVMKIAIQQAFLMRYDGYAYLVKKQALVEAVDFELEWQGEDSIKLPNGYRLMFVRSMGEGIKFSELKQPLIIKSRQGGERLKVDVSRPEKPLKQWFQLAKIPPWERVSYPCLYHENQLLFVPEIGCHPSFQASVNEASLKVTLIKP